MSTNFGGLDPYNMRTAWILLWLTKNILRSIVICSSDQFSPFNFASNWLVEIFSEAALISSDERLEYSCCFFCGSNFFKDLLSTKNKLVLAHSYAIFECYPPTG